MKYRLTDHTADFGVQAYGRTLAQVFEHAAFALYDLITDTGILIGNQTMPLAVTGDDPDDLMMNWLRELLYLWSGSERLVKSAKIQKMTAYEINAILCYDRYDPEKHVIKNEIKAVTYHQIQVERLPRGWEARVIFDV